MRRGALHLVFWAAAGVLALPLLLIVAGSFGDGAVPVFPPGRISLRWYRAVLADPEVREAFVLSAGLAVACGVLSVLVGSWVALAAAASRGWVRAALLGGAVLPLVTPGVVHALALRIGIQAVGLSPGAGAMLLGHVIHAAPFATLMVGARLAGLPPVLLDAARDAGAGAGACFRHVALPWLRPALLGAGALAALTSFDDFIRSLFLGGYDPTLPVLVFARMRGALTPEVHAIAALVLLLVLLAGWAASGWGKPIH